MIQPSSTGSRWSEVGGSCSDPAPTYAVISGSANLQRRSSMSIASYLPVNPLLDEKALSDSLTL
jgi:hypothetical protein